MKNDVIWVDELDNELGVVSREKAHREGLLHRIAVVYLINESGQILIQHRTDGRLDHSSAGHVDVGEDYETAAARELQEELGVSYEIAEIGKCLSDEPDQTKHTHVRHIFKIFTAKGEPGKLAPREVKTVFWADPKAVWQEMQSDPENKKFCGGFTASLKLYLKKNV